MTLNLAQIFGTDPIVTAMATITPEADAVTPVAGAPTDAPSLGGSDPDPAFSAFTDPEVFAAYSDFCWLELYPEDYRHLTAPRNYPSPCPWCGGRLVHNRLCDELRNTWEPTLPFGKHKGKRLSEVPVDYLLWLLKRGVGDTELEKAIALHLETHRVERDPTDEGGPGIDF